MPDFEEWTFSGAFGRKYRFVVHPRRQGVFEGITPQSAVYVLGYRHPRGHLAGDVIEPVYIGHTDDLAARLADHPHWDCIIYEACNCVCVLADQLSEEERAACAEDLRRGNATPCGDSPQ